MREAGTQWVTRFSQQARFQLVMLVVIVGCVVTLFLYDAGSPNVLAFAPAVGGVAFLWWDYRRAPRVLAELGLIAQGGSLIVLVRGRPVSMSVESVSIARSTVGPLGWVVLTDSGVTSGRVRGTAHWTRGRAAFLRRATPSPPFAKPAIAFWDGDPEDLRAMLAESSAEPERG